MGNIITQLSVLCFFRDHVCKSMGEKSIGIGERVYPFVNPVFRKDNGHTVMYLCKLPDGGSCKNNKFRKAVNNPVQSAHPGHDVTVWLDHIFVTGGGFAIGVFSMLPFDVSGSGDDTAVPQPGFFEKLLFRGGFDSCIHHGL